MTIRGLILMFSSIDRPTQLWLGVLVALCLATILYFATRFGLRRIKFSDDDMKAAGLNHRERRRLKARLRRKRRQKNIRL